MFDEKKEDKLLKRPSGQETHSDLEHFVSQEQSTNTNTNTNENTNTNTSTY